MTLRIWLDDERPKPGASWVATDDPRQVIEWLERAEINGKRPDNIEMSLDHDLGPPETHGTGMDVLEWIEEQVARRGYVPPERIHVHTANAVARERMFACLASIWRLHKSGRV